MLYAHNKLNAYTRGLSHPPLTNMRPAHTYLKRRHALGHLALAVTGVLAAAAIGCMLAGDNVLGLVAAALVALGLSAWWTR